MAFPEGTKITTTLVRQNGRWVNEGMEPGKGLTDHEVYMLVNVRKTWRIAAWPKRKEKNASASPSSQD